MPRRVPRGQHSTKHGFSKCPIFAELFSAVSITDLCRVPDIMHSANTLALNKVADSGSATTILNRYESVFCYVFGDTNPTYLKSPSTLSDFCLHAAYPCHHTCHLSGSIAYPNTHVPLRKSGRFGSLPSIHCHVVHHPYTHLLG